MPRKRRNIIRNCQQVMLLQYIQSSSFRRSAFLSSDVWWGCVLHIFGSFVSRVLLVMILYAGDTPTSFRPGKFFFLSILTHLVNIFLGFVQASSGNWSIDIASFQCYFKIILQSDVLGICYNQIRYIIYKISSSS